MSKTFTGLSVLLFDINEQVIVLTSAGELQTGLVIAQDVTGAKDPATGALTGLTGLYMVKLLNNDVVSLDGSKVAAKTSVTPIAAFLTWPTP